MLCSVKTELKVLIHFLLDKAEWCALGTDLIPAFMANLYVCVFACWLLSKPSRILPMRPDHVEWVGTAWVMCLCHMVRGLCAFLALQVYGNSTANGAIAVKLFQKCFCGIVEEKILLQLHSLQGGKEQSCHVHCKHFSHSCCLWSGLPDCVVLPPELTAQSVCCCFLNFPRLLCHA